MNRQNQKGGDNAKMLQAGGNITQNFFIGASEDEMKKIALEIFESNFYKFANKAQEITLKRAKEFTDITIHRLFQDHPSGFDAASDPDFQYILYSAQRDFARTGDRNVGDILVDLIIERCKNTDRSIRQIICNESLNIVPKLNTDMINILGIVFFFRHFYSGVDTNQDRTTQYPKLDEISLPRYFRKYLVPFGAPTYASASCYRHLQTTTCCTLSRQKKDNLLEIIRDHRRGYFQTGFTQKDLDQSGLSKHVYDLLITPCLNDRSKLQINAASDLELIAKYGPLNLSKQDKLAVTYLFSNYVMDHAGISKKLENSCPELIRVIYLWLETSLSEVNLTVNGIAIGHAALKRHADNIPDLSYWIN